MAEPRAAGLPAGRLALTVQGASPARRAPWSWSAVAPLQIDRPLILTLAAALVIGELPLVLAGCCAPAGATGFGTAWFVNDFAQYESAMRQGATAAGWPIFDKFTAEAHQPVLMFPLYVAIGKLAALLSVAPELIERTVEVLARAALVLALWRFARAFAATRGAAVAALLLALFGSGFEVIVAAAGASYLGNWSYETNTFGMLFAAPHVPLAMAATLELAHDWLRPVSRLRWPLVVKGAALGAGVALLHPFHVPVLLAALVLVGLVFWRTRQGAGSLVGAAAAAAGALPVLWPTAATFSYDGFWSATYGGQNVLPSPAPHELLVDLGPALLLALAGALAWRSRIAPFGVVVWLLLMLIAMYIPVPYQRRLGFGVQPAMALLAGNALVAAGVALSAGRARALRLLVFLSAATGSVLVLVSIAASGVRDAPLSIYRSTQDLDAAANWLALQANASDVILADWDVMNYLAPRTAARSFGGHPVATLHAGQKQTAVATVFVHNASREVARQYGATWLVYGPAEAALPGPGTPDYAQGAVRIYRVSGP